MRPRRAPRSQHGPRRFARWRAIHASALAAQAIALAISLAAPMVSGTTTSSPMDLRCGPVAPDLVAVTWSTQDPWTGAQAFLSNDTSTIGLLSASTVAVPNGSYLHAATLGPVAAGETYNLSLGTDDVGTGIVGILSLTTAGTATCTLDHGARDSGKGAKGSDARGPTTKDSHGKAGGNSHHPTSPPAPPPAARPPVRPPDPAPLRVTAEANASSGTAPLTVGFRTKVSGGAPPYAYAWTFGDGGTSREADPAHVYRDPGSYTAGLRVTDAQGQHVEGNLTIEVAKSLQVAVRYDQMSRSDARALWFHGNATGGRGPYVYAWDFGDGARGAGPDPTHTYADDGNYTVSVRVTDARGQVASATLALRVVRNASTIGSILSSPLLPLAVAGILVAATAAALLALRRQRLPGSAPGAARPPRRVIAGPVQSPRVEGSPRALQPRDPWP